MAINNNDFETKVQQAIDKSIVEIDSTTLSKLNQARQHALAHTKGSYKPHSTWFISLLTSAAMAVLVITVIPTSQQQLAPPSTAAHLDVLVMSVDEELDLYEDLEFYQWLDNTNG